MAAPNDNDNSAAVLDRLSDPPDFTSPDGLALLHQFVSFLQDPSKPNKTYDDFIAETAGQYTRPLTVTELANGMYDIAYTKDIADILANIDEIEEIIKKAEEALKDVREPTDYHRPLDTNDIEALKNKPSFSANKPSYQGTINVLDIHLQRARKRQFEEKTVPNYIAYKEETARLNLVDSIQKAFAPHIAQGVITQNDVDNITTAATTVLGSEEVQTPQQLVTTISQNTPGGLPPQTMTLLNETMTPPFFAQIHDPFFEVKHVQQVNQVLQTFKKTAQDFTNNVVTAPEEPSEGAPPSQETAFYAESGISHYVKNKLDKKLNALVDEGIVRKELKDRLLTKSSYHVTRALSVYASAKDLRDVRQAVAEAFQESVKTVTAEAVEQGQPGERGEVAGVSPEVLATTAAEQAEAIISRINLDDPASPLITPAIEHALDANRVLHLLPYAAEGDETEAVTQILQTMANREAMSGTEVFGDQLQALQNDVTLRTQAAPAEVEGKVPGNALMAFVARNEQLATEEGAEAPIWLTSSMVEENVQREQADLFAHASGMPRDQAMQRQASINEGLRLAQFLRIAESDPELARFVTLELFTDFDDIANRLQVARAQGNLAHARVYQTILTYREEHQNALAEFIRDERRNEQAKELLRPFRLKGWQEPSTFMAWMDAELKKYGNNQEKLLKKQSSLVHQWLYFKDREKQIRLINILLRNPWIKALTSDDFVGTVVAHYRNKIALASGKWVYKSSRKAIVFATKKAIMPVAKGVGGVVASGFKQAGTQIRATRQYKFLVGRARSAGQAGPARFITRPTAAVYRQGIVPTFRALTKTVPEVLRKRLAWVGKLTRLAAKGVGKVIGLLVKVITPILNVLFLLSAIKFISKIAKRVIKAVGAYLYALLLWLKQFIWVFYAAMAGATVGFFGGMIAGAILGAKGGALLGTLICGPGCGLVGGIFGTVVGGAVGAVLGSALGASLAGALMYTLQFFVMPHLVGAILGAGIALGIALALPVFWPFIPIVLAGFYLGAGVQWLAEKFIGSHLGLKTEIAVSNLTHNPPKLGITSSSNISSEAVATRGAVAQAGVGGPGLPVWLSNPLIAGLGISAILIPPIIIMIILSTLSPPEVNRTQLRLIAPSTVPNATTIPYTVSANFPNCAGKVTIENPLPTASELQKITDPLIKTGGTLKVIYATASATKITWTIYTYCTEAPPAQAAGQIGSFVTTASLQNTYVLTSDFCQGLNPQGCSNELKRTFEAAANFSNIPAGVIAGIANQEWKATFKHTDSEIKQWSTPGETKEPNGPTDHPRFIDGCARSFAYAEGPMQFLTGKGGYPDIWSSYKGAVVQAGIRNQNYDPQACNVLDAIFGASKKLKTNSGIGFATQKLVWEQADVERAAKAYLGACIPKYNPNLNYCEGVWQYYRTFTPKEL